MEDYVAFGEVIEVGAAVFGAFAVGNDYELQALPGYLRGQKPTGGQK